MVGLIFGLRTDRRVMLIDLCLCLIALLSARKVRHSGGKV